jgi:hypothetical protein
MGDTVRGPNCGKLTLLAVAAILYDLKPSFFIRIYLNITEIMGPVHNTVNRVG